jgi:IclR family transcriptional regulator, acetate operon repressor
MPNDHGFPSAVSVERAAQTLTLLAENGDSTVTDLARTLDVSASAVHRILTALRRQGFVEQDPISDRYRLSWTVLKLARSLIARSDVREMALPHIRRLTEELAETVTLSVRVGFERVLIEQVVPNREVHWRAPIGSVSPLYAGATGKALLAFMPQTERARFFREVEMRPLTDHTAADRRALERELARIRRDGYAIGDRDRVPEVAGASVPIFDAEGAVSFALSVAGPAERCPVEGLVSVVETKLLPAANEISFLQGYRSAASHG